MGKSPCIMSVQYTGGCTVQQGMFSTPGDIMSTHWGVFNIMSTPGHIMTNVGEGH